MPATPARTRAIPSPHPQAAERFSLSDKAKLTRTRLTSRTRPPVRNRVRVLLVHIPRLSIQGQARLAAEAGVSRSTISRLVNGRISPSYRLVEAVTAALGRHMGEYLDPREVFTTDGTYPTASGCALCRCGGCLPEEAYDGDGSRRPEWRDARPGDWSLASADPQGRAAGDGAS